MQSGPAAKRTKTLTQEVAKLKKQVSQNKHEVKYFDAQLSVNNNVPDSSLFFDSQDNTRALFVGRKIYVHKIEYSFEYENADIRALIYRMRKGNLVTKATPWNYPREVDPELHTMLRIHVAKEDSDKEFVRGLIDFKGSPRLVEFDDSNGTAEGTTITVGDIRLSVPPFATQQLTVHYRLWYHDG